MKEFKIAVIGLGYVGLPLAIEFGKKYKVLGFDINKERIEELQRGVDHTLEADLQGLSESTSLRNNNPEQGLSFSSNEADLNDYNTYIVTVPTPINNFNMPDLNPLIRASEMLGRVISKGDIAIYESTTYPGCTEEDCVPVIAKVSGLTFNVDFFAGYSPERINPGDKVNTLTKIKKVTSGQSKRIICLHHYSRYPQSSQHKSGGSFQNHRKCPTGCQYILCKRIGAYI
jgi:UDP-N-acetyl-D-galactosamine dehydrogenase